MSKPPSEPHSLTFPSPNELLIEFSLSQVAARRTQTIANVDDIRPVFIGLQGPQGIGKSTLARLIKDQLASEPHKLLTIVLSLDDLYLSYSDQQKLQDAYPQNKLLQGRGLPGTHDLTLAQDVLQSLADINRTRLTEIPRYDKAAHGGLGDRNGFETIVVSEGKKVDLVILEGWMTGFLPISPTQLETQYIDALQASKAQCQDHPPFVIQHALEDLMQINNRLADYVEKIWKRLDSIVTLVPEDLAYVWEWRLQQEHEMKAKNGGIGMSDEAVQHFIARYMPCYELYSKSAIGDQLFTSAWHDKGLKVVMNQERCTVEVSRI